MKRNMIDYNQALLSDLGDLSQYPRIKTDDLHLPLLPTKTNIALQMYEMLGRLLSL